MEKRDLLFDGGYTLIYDDELTKPGTDAFVLSAFPKLRRGLRCADLGAGVGVIGLLMLARESGITVDGIEIDPLAAAVAEKNASENGIADKMKTHAADLRIVENTLKCGAYDLVVSNPPYFKTGSGARAEGDARRNAREENLCTLEDVFAAAGKLLRWSGHFCMVNRPERLADIICAARETSLEPKRLRFVCASPDKTPSLLLIDCAKGGKPALAVEPPLILRDADGRESAEFEEIYFRGRREA